jgi:ATP-dependent Clp protease ATP-binding subunit ClpC
MFQRLTKKAIKVLNLAQHYVPEVGPTAMCQLMERTHRYHVSPEHILLGLTSEGTSLAAATLKSMGISHLRALSELQKLIGPGPGVKFPDRPMSPHAKKILEVASTIADDLGHEHIGTEHILLGLLRGGGGLSLDVLRNLGIDLGELEDRLLQEVADWDKPPELVLGTGET